MLRFVNFRSLFILIQYKGLLENGKEERNKLRGELEFAEGVLLSYTVYRVVSCTIVPKIRKKLGSNTEEIVSCFTQRIEYAL